MNRTKIDWRNPAEGWKLDYTWNPVIGCKRNCSYCYARRMNIWLKWIPNWNELKFFPERLEQPSKVKKPSTFFVGSVSDICYWEKEWVKSVIEVCENCKQHRFMFLTKGIYIYNLWMFSVNSWLGLTINSDMDYIKYINFLNIHDYGNKKFLSIEPLMGPVHLALNESEIELVIVGADTSRKPVIPKKEWIDRIKHPNIHYKNNIKKYMIGNIE